MRTFKPIIALALALPACWSPPPDDAGDVAWVRTVVPTLLGRKPRNSEEVRVLADYTATHGREVVARMLMDQPEFATYWAQVLAEDLEPNRAHDGTQDADCWERPMLEPHRLEHLTTLLAHADPTTRLCYTVERGVEQPEIELLTPGGWEGIHNQQADGRGGTPHLDGTPTWSEPELGAAAPTRSAAALTFDPESVTPRWIGPPDASSSYAGLELDHTDSRNLPRAPGVSRDEASEDGAGSSRGDAPVSTSVCYPFNMADVVLAAVTEDDLFGAYRAYLAPLSTFFSGSSETSKRRFLGRRMLDVYVNRDPSCMSCHTTNWSATDARPRNGMWDRFDHPAYDLEGGAFSYTDGGSLKYGGNGGADLEERLRNYFRTDQHPTSGGYNPFGLSDDCVTAPGVDGWAWGGVGADTEASSRAGIAQQPLADDYTVADLAEYLRIGMLGLDDIAVEYPQWQTTGQPPSGIFAVCTNCHQGSYSGGPNAYVAPDLSEIVPTMSNERLFEVIKHGSGTMPALGWSDAHILSVIAHMRQVEGWYDPVAMPADGREALAVFLAHNIVDNIVEEAMGGRFTIHHGHYRNGDAKNPHSWLLAGFLADGWSLRRVLLDLVTSEAYARNAPAHSTQEYTLPMLAYPWAEAPPYQSNPPVDADANSAGDHVYRYSVQNLFHSFGWGMHWPTPRTFGGDRFPKSSSMQEVGRREERRIPAVDEVTFGTLLGWEKALTRSEYVLDACEKPLVYRVDVPYVTVTNTWTTISGNQYEDWIDIASQQADGTHTVEEVALALKDRMITDPTMHPGEGPLIETLIGASLTDTWSDAAMEGGLRQFCGVLAKTPQFMLGGLADSAPLPAASPTFVPCSDGLCTYDQLDDHYDAFLCAAGAGFEYCADEPIENPGDASE